MPALPPPWRHDRIALGAYVGLVARSANANGFSYAPGFAFGAHLDVPFVRWLSLSFHYLHASQSVSVDGQAAFGTPGAVGVSDSLSSYELGARLQPTLSIGDRAAVWLNLGAAWGVVNFPTLSVPAPDPYVLGTPHHTFVEFPLGLGGQWEFVPQWLAVQANATFGVLVDDSAPPVQSVTQAGLVVYTRALPGFSRSFVSTIGVVLKL